MVEQRYRRCHARRQVKVAQHKTQHLKLQTTFSSLHLQTGKVCVTSYQSHAGAVPASYFEGGHESKQEEQGTNLLQVSFFYGNPASPDYEEIKQLLESICINNLL